MNCVSTELFTYLEPIDADVRMIRLDYPEPINKSVLGLDESKYEIHEVYRRYEK